MSHFEDKLNPNSTTDEVLEAVEELLQEMISFQDRKLAKYARSIIPNLTDEDILQPHDFPLLDKNIRFQYEDGQLASLRGVLLAFRSRIVRKINTEM
jgi:hypothetical protein